MSSTPDEIAALLVLPAEARAALAACEGPGWRPPFGWDVADTRHATHHAVVAWELNTTAPIGRRGWWWLPNDSAQVMVAVSRGAPYVIRPNPDAEDEAWIAAIAGYSATGDTPRLAALHLLAAVWSGR